MAKIRLEKCVTVRKMGHTEKNGSHLEIWLTHLEKGVTVRNMDDS